MISTIKLIFFIFCFFFFYSPIKAQEIKPGEVYFFPIDSVKKENHKVDSLYKHNWKNIGYCIGGISFLGIEYEYRFKKILGLSAGIGLIGCSAGIRLYLNPKITSPFLFVGLKDAGFGFYHDQLSFDIGKRFHIKKKKSKFFFQLGVAMVINSYMQFSDGSYLDTGDIIPSFGIGISR